MIKLTGAFDALGKNVPGDDIRFWFARDLQEPLGYARWENFTTAIQRAMESCKSAGFNIGDHFRDVTKMITDIESGRFARLHGTLNCRCKILPAGISQWFL